MKTATDVTVILDRSGSMESIATDVIGGFNTFLHEQRRVPGECLLSLVQFDNEYEVVYAGVPIADAARLTKEAFVPRGTTALLDAIGRTIDDTGRRLEAMAAPDRPGRVLIAIMTDGLENASSDYTRAKVLALIERQRTIYKWSFLFLAANQDAIAEGASIGIQAQDAINYLATGDGARQANMVLSERVMTLRNGNDSSDELKKAVRKKTKVH